MYNYIAVLYCINIIERCTYKQAKLLYLIHRGYCMQFLAFYANKGKSGLMAAAEAASKRFSFTDKSLNAAYWLQLEACRAQPDRSAKMAETDREPEDIIGAFLKGENTRELTEEEKVMAVEAMADELPTRSVEIDKALAGQLQVAAAIAGEDNVQAYMEALLKHALSQDDHRGLDIARIERAMSQLWPENLTKEEIEVIELVEESRRGGSDIPR